jgi:multiple sugar transport system substrate-binding protein
MTAPVYRGLTWDHPRGYRALEAAAARLDPDRDGLVLSWDRHSLEGFEERPIGEQCALYDLVVLDHPHVGEAVAADGLVSLEDLFDAGEIAAWRAAVMGRCLDSYHYAGRHWALPLDAATQVMAWRKDRLDGPPTLWDEVVRLSQTGGLLLSLSGPHAALTFQSICAAHGAPPAADGETFMEPAAGRAAWNLLSRLAAHSPPALRPLNPIGLLEHMSRHEDVAVCPLVYGYVNYAPDGALAFADAPRVAADGPVGSILGGTGIGVSRRCAVTPQLLDHLRWLMADATQRGFIPDEEGQPALKAAWRDPAVNARWGDFYANTYATLDGASLRPRHDGAIAFQAAASQRIRVGLDAAEAADPVLDDLQALFARHRPMGAET